ALAEIGADGEVCFHNSEHAEVDLVADRIARLAAESFRPNPGDGGPVRVADTREGLAGDRLVPGERRCFGVPGVPGDVVVVNLTPVGASGAGHGALTSSEVVELPAVSNVNFSVGSVDPNVALAEIGADGEVCFHNSEHAEVDLVADVLLTIRADAFTSAPYLSRLVDTRNERRDVVECVTATRCYAAGDQFYRSDDGGVIWRLSESVAYLDRYDDDAIHCFDTDVCRYFGYWYYGRQSAGTSYMTLDGGLNWRRVGSLEWLAGLACPEADTCIAVGSYSNLITLNITFRSAAVTDDGGRTWRNISLPPASGPGRLTGITCSSATRCEAVSVVGTVGNEVTTQIVFESTDGWDTVTVIDP
ncbi:MAG: hypothetical protein KDB37_21150, partial [Ilumatobacter sp.]|nr:hypothetical protein [Ilumatobacter sp.]